jgi:hypothetical protein
LIMFNQQDAFVGTKEDGLGGEFAVQMIPVPQDKLQRLSALLQDAYGKHQSRSLRMAMRFVDRVLLPTGD